MNILITGSRAPASMDMMRSLIHQGYNVYSADSMRFPLGRFVKGLKKHFTVPKPNRYVPHFINAIQDIVIDNKIDIVIPTCEEIFFLSQGYEQLSKYTRLLCEPFERLLPLHDKYAFNQLVVEYGLNAPESWLLNNHQDKKQLPIDMPMVLKPVYSRFGSDVIIKPQQETINALLLERAYLAQRFINGKEFCAYAIVYDGKVLVQSCYHPKYTAGPAAGIYFEPANISAITHFIEVFCQKYQFSGQIAFDFIVENQKAFVLECNPRITSGFHLIADTIQWSNLFNGKQHSQSLLTQPYMLGLGMKIHGCGYFYAQPKQVINDYRIAHDVLKNDAYPWIGLKSIMTIMNILLRMIIEKKSFHSASTDDIEYNGKVSG